MNNIAYSTEIHINSSFKIKEIEQTKRNFFLAMIDRKALPMIIVPG